MDGFKSPAERRNVLQAGIDMYYAHNANFDTTKINILTPESFLRPAFPMGGIAAGEDDIAAGDDDIAAGDDDIAAGSYDIVAGDYNIAAGDDDIAAGDDDIAAGDDDIAADDDIIAAEDTPAPKPMMGFKIASFAGTGAVASIRTLDDCCICRWELRHLSVGSNLTGGINILPMGNYPRMYYVVMYYRFLL